MAKTNAIDRLTHLKDLLKIERNEDYRLYKEQFLRVDLEKRKKNGVTWYPVKINNEEQAKIETALQSVDTLKSNFKRKMASAKIIDLTKI
jgi:hypothetical protein